MNQYNSTIDAILKLSTLSHLPTKDAVQILGAGIDAAWDTKKIKVLKHIVDTLAASLDIEQMNQDDVCLFHYFIANAWNGIKVLSCSTPGGSWVWESQAIQKEVINIRRALSSSGLIQQPAIRVCQIHTNLANCYNTTGRFVEAISEWDRALQIEPRFGMAIGNRASGVWTYAKSIYDNGHAVVMAREAWTQLDLYKLEGLEPGADKYFTNVRAEIESMIPREVLTTPFDLNESDLGETQEEQEYRQWCLSNKFFLNPLNDLGPISIAARDILTCPSIVANIGEGPRFHDYMNQIKQEYCSARWLVYYASRNQPPHFSDKDVFLYNTLDYPSYGLHTEQLKLGFRALYSLFDKIAFFLNAYLDLGITENKVSFRGLWYINQSRNRGVRSEFDTRENWPLRGLFWLGKDLYENANGYRDVLYPAAKRLNEIRNHLEHKYLKLHSGLLWNGTESITYMDGLAVSLGRCEFEGMSMHLLSMTRAAIIYLTLGVHREEKVRKNQLDPNTIIPPMAQTKWEDDWKS